MKKKPLYLTFFYKISTQDLFNYKSVYVMRVKHTDGTYRTLLHQASVFSVSDDGKIQQTLCVHTDITYLNIPINHTVSFISSKKPSYHYSKKLGSYAIVDENSPGLEKNYFKDIFSKREKEIVESVAKGLTFNEIATQLFLSPHAINTHKKNILSKSGCKNTAELIARYYIDNFV